MYHVELRQFPHNMCRFNLDKAALAAILDPWVQRRVVEFGERKWHPEQARVRILEGPSIPVAQLTMGRGWRTAERQSTDVTERLLAEAEANRDVVAAAEAAAAGESPKAPSATAPGPSIAAASDGGLAGAGGAQAASGTAPAGDPFALGMQMAAVLGPDAMRLLDAWRAAAASSPGLAPSETLALAERSLRGG
jgi:hypothetical protein